MRINRFIIIFAALATLAWLVSGCNSPISGEIPALSAPEEDTKGGNFGLSLIVPDYKSWDFSQTPGAKVIDPETATVEVMALGGWQVGSFTFPDDGTLTAIGNNCNSWELNIDLPISEYSPGDLEVILKDNGGTTLTSGFNQESFNIGTSSTGSPVEITIGCIPEIHTGVFITDPATPVSGGSISLGSNKYFSFNVAHGLEYTVIVTNGTGDGEPDLYLFDQSGIPVGYSEASGGEASLSAYQAVYGGKLYVGVNAVGGDVTAFDLTVSSDSAAVGNRTSPLINELYFVSPGAWREMGAIEFFNPTASDIDMSGYILDIAIAGYASSQRTLPADSVIPANGFLVLFSDNPQEDYNNLAIWRMCYAEIPGSFLFNGGGWWLTNNIEVILTHSDGTTELDMVLLNSATQSGIGWSGNGFAASFGTVARNIDDGYNDSDDSTDWINTYSTLGMPNDYTEDVDVMIGLF